MSIISETNAVMWPNIFAFLSLEQTATIFNEVNVPLAFYSNNIDGAKFRVIIKEYLPKIISLEDQDLHYGGANKEDIHIFWRDLSNSLSYVTESEWVEKLYAWGNNIRLSSQGRMSIFNKINFALDDTIEKYKLGKVQLLINHDASYNERLLLNLFNIYSLRLKSLFSIFNLLDASIANDAKTVKWINGIYPLKYEYQIPDNFLENSISIMINYAELLIIQQLTYVIRDLFSELEFQKIMHKLTREKDLKDLLLIYEKNID